VINSCKLSILRKTFLIILITFISGTLVFLYAEKECPNCHKRYSDDENFCSKCADSDGSPVKLVSREKPKSEPRPPPQPSSPPAKSIIEANITVDVDSIIVLSKPTGAAMYLDDAYKANSPLFLTDIAVGHHHIKLTYPGYEDYETNVEIKRAVKADITIISETLKITSVPSGAAINIDSVYKGNTPTVITNTAHGFHLVRISYPNYYDYVNTIEIAEPIKFDVKVIKDSAMIISQPAGASVFLDSEYESKTPCTLNDLGLGTHTIKFSSTGYRNATTTINVKDVVREKGYYKISGSRVFDVYVIDTFAYVACGNSGLHILNISNPSIPVEIGYVDTPDESRGVIISESYAYLADGRAGFRIIDIRNQSKPHAVSLYRDVGLVENVCISGSFAFLADWDSTLRVIDISVPGNPSEAGYYKVRGSVFGVFVANPYAYLATWASGLRIINIANPSDITEIGHYDTHICAHGIYLSGNYAYVADSAGLRILNISNPTQPFEVGFYKTPSCAFGIYVSENIAYVAAGTAGLRIIDVTDPSRPFEVDHYDTPGMAWNVYVSGHDAYVADYYEGMRIIKVR